MSEILIWHTAPAAGAADVYARLVSPAESERAQWFRRFEDTLSYLASRALLRLALAAYLGADPRHLVFDRRCPDCGDAEHGRPALQKPRGARAEFSLTRARSVVAVAVAGERLGLDAESARPGLDGLVHSEVFSEEDRAWLGLPGSGSSASRLLDLWVRKEAVGKASGLGLADASRIQVPSGAAAGWAPARDARGRPCLLATVCIPSATAAAVVTYGSPGGLRVLDARALGLPAA